MISRRQFLATTVLSLAGCSQTSNKFVPEPTPTDYVSNLIDGFPVRLVGAKEIRKYKVPRSRHCLAHILQYHSSQFSQVDPEKLRIVQNKMYLILSHLRLKHELKLRSVYSEGIHEGRIKQLHNFRKKINRNLGINAENAVDRHFFRGNLELKAAESKELYDNAVRAFQCLEQKSDETMPGIEFAALVKIIYEDREDFLLKTISEQDDIFAVAPFDAKHAFGGESLENYKLGKRVSAKDNIGEWNSQHPERKFSLIEIIPEGVEI